VSDTDELIGGALRDLAAQAVTVPPTADALWRAGQRRRRRNVVAIAATAPGAAAVAVVLAFTLGGGQGTPSGHRGSLGGATGATGSLVLSTPIQFKQVAQVSKRPCTAGAKPVNGSDGTPYACIRFTGAGMAVTRLESARVQRDPQGHQYQIVIRMTPADARRFASLTREVARQLSPRNQLAVVTNGYVLSDPVVQSAITAGQAAIAGYASRPAAEFALATYTRG
jgi:preprotein translocase subunit SecD